MAQSLDKTGLSDVDVTFPLLQIIRYVYDQYELHQYDLTF